MDSDTKKIVDQAFCLKNGQAKHILYWDVPYLNTIYKEERAKHGK